MSLELTLLITVPSVPTVLTTVPRMVPKAVPTVPTKPYTFLAVASGSAQTYTDFYKA